MHRTGSKSSSRSSSCRSTGRRPRQTVARRWEGLREGRRNGGVRTEGNGAWIGAAPRTAHVVLGIGVGLHLTAHVGLIRHGVPTRIGCTRLVSAVRGLRSMHHCRPTSIAFPSPGSVLSVPARRRWRRSGSRSFHLRAQRWRWCDVVVVGLMGAWASRVWSAWWWRLCSRWVLPVR